MPIRRRLLLALPALALAGACFSDPKYPGDQVLGTFRFTASLDKAHSNCQVVSADAGMPDGGFAIIEGAGTTFTFDGTFSKQADGGSGWFTINGFSREATYDSAAQTVSSPYTATLPLAGCTGSQMDETLAVHLLSTSQNAAVGQKCSGIPDGGIPVDVDGGILPPGPNENGYDVERACGSLNDNFVPAASTSCKPCTAVYTVEGERLKQ
jgi:hypothetical protein